MTSLRHPFGTRGHAIDTRIPPPSSPARTVAPTIARLISERNPHGVERVAKLLERIDAMPAGCDPEPREACANGCGRPCAERVRTGEGPGARGGKRPDYCGPGCEREARNRRRRGRARGWTGDR